MSAFHKSCSKDIFSVEVLLTFFRKADRKRLYMGGGFCFLVGWVVWFFLSWGGLSLGLKQSSRAELCRALQQRQEARSWESRTPQLPAGGSVQQQKTFEEHPKSCWTTNNIPGQIQKWFTACSYPSPHLKEPRHPLFWFTLPLPQDSQWI